VAWAARFLYCDVSAELMIGNLSVLNCHLCLSVVLPKIRPAAQVPWAARERLVAQDRVIEHPRATLIVPLSDTSHLSHCRTDGTQCDACDTASKGPRESCELGDLFGSGVPQTALLSHCRIAVAPCDTCDRAI
jgi:hypothetical protein